MGVSNYVLVGVYVTGAEFKQSSNQSIGCLFICQVPTKISIAYLCVNPPKLGS